MNFEHKSVLLYPTVDSLKVKPDGIYVDGTLGGGGHAAAAGCTVEAPWTEAKRRILDAVAQVAPDFLR